MKWMVPRSRSLLPLALLLVAVAACSAVAERASEGGARLPARTVIMISLDGTSPQDLTVDELEALPDLVRRGSAASRLVPAFPTNTFPNHVTLVTGVSPAVHGIVNNVFADPERGLFKYANDPGWIEVEPLWAIADRHGVVSAAYHWVGSEGAWRNGHGPKHWKRFDGATPERKKVQQILAWLDAEDAAERPRLITTWFHGADHEGHRHGPGSPEARAALREQDRALAELVSGLEARGAFATTTLLVVSDHGMVPVEKHVDLNAALKAAGVSAWALGGGGIATLAFDGGSDDVARATAVAESLGLALYAPDALPEGVSGANPRFGAAVVLAPVGTAISSGSTAEMRGAHGYLPAEPGMSAICIAMGAGIPAGASLGEVRIVDVAPTVLAWLGIPRPDWMEGRPIAALVAGADADETAAVRATPTGAER